MTLPNPIDELIEKLDRWAACSHGRVLAPSDLLETASAALSTLQEQKRKLEEALTPSGDTKAAYIGEVKDSYVEVDEDGEERTVWRPVSWTATKEIMALIRARALLSGGGE